VEIRRRALGTLAAAGIAAGLVVVAAEPASAHTLCGSYRTVSVPIPTWFDQQYKMRSCVYEYQGMGSRMDVTWYLNASFGTHNSVHLRPYIRRSDGYALWGDCDITAAINYEVTTGRHNTRSFTCYAPKITYRSGYSYYAGGAVVDDVANDGKGAYTWYTYHSPNHY